MAACDRFLSGRISTCGDTHRLRTLDLAGLFETAEEGEEEARREAENYIDASRV
jgi:hypothetical protein